MTHFTRRQFIALAATGAAALITGCGRAPAGGVTLEPTSTRKPSFNPSIESILQEIIITPNDDLYVQSFASIPEVNIKDWKLKMDGWVREPITLTYDDLRALPNEKVMRTLECIGNPAGGPLIGNIVWTGTRLKPLLDRVGLKENVLRAKFEAADGYSTSIDLQFINVDSAFIAYEMNGERLDAKHGFPARIFFGGSYGQKMPKWITRIEVVDYDFQGYWERSGWSDEAVVKTMSKFTTLPRTGSVEEIGLGGVAYAGDRAVYGFQGKIMGSL